MVLNYHRVLPVNSSWNEHVLDIGAFDAQVKQLVRFFNVLSLEDALLQAASGTLPSNSVVITVDDGFSDCYYYIFPVLRRYGVKATFFISTAGIEHGYLWENQISDAILQAKVSVKSIFVLDTMYKIETPLQRREAILQLTELFKYRTLDERESLISSLFQQTGEPELKHDFVTSDQLKEMHAAGMTIGAHTVNHPILALESLDVATKEIKCSKFFLQNLLQADVNFFAYPNGKFNIDFSQEHADLVQTLGFQAAFSTDRGTAKPLKDSLFKLKRFTPWDRNPWLFTCRLLILLLSEKFNIAFLKNWVGTQHD